MVNSSTVLQFQIDGNLFLSCSVHYILLLLNTIKHTKLQNFWKTPKIPETPKSRAFKQIYLVSIKKNFYPGAK